MKIAIDFDGVIIDHKDIPTRKDWWNDDPMQGARESIELLLKKGHKVYVFTNRTISERADVKMWLYKHGFPILKVTNRKLKNTALYVDDRAYRFTTWNDIYKFFG